TRMSGVLGHALGRKYSRDGACESSVKYCVSSSLVLRQAKYVYDCVNPAFARRCIGRGRVNASDRKTTSGCTALTSAISQSHSANGFVCGLSTRKTRSPSTLPWSTMLFSSSHSARQSSVSKLNG